MSQLATQIRIREMLLFLSVAALCCFFVVAPNASAVANGTTFPSPHMGSSTTASAQHGYWLVGSDGGVFSFGSARFYSSAANLHLQSSVVGITPTADRGGYWLVASDGGVFSFGDANFYGSIPGLGIAPDDSPKLPRLNAPIVDMVSSQDGRGYYLVAADGGVFTFGDAKFEGSCPGIGGCSSGVAAMMTDGTGNGYWLVTYTGDVYAFGDATDYGGPAAYLPYATEVLSAVRTPSGNGYWILFSDGEIYTYGDAAYLGSPFGQIKFSNPASAVFATTDGFGYWVTSFNGTVYAYGDAPNDGDLSATHLNGPIVGATGS
jgi:hypothetical protein